MGGFTWKGTFAVILFSLASTSSTYAFDRIYCDPGSDPEECECPAGPCESQYISELPTTDQPSVVRSQSNLSTTWDSSQQAWIVEADVGAMKTGVIRVTSNAGIYANTGAFYEYLSTLLGVTMPNQISIDGRLFPPIILEQRGVSHRLSETTERWDLLQSRNILFDMLLSSDGTVTIDGVQLDVFQSDVNCAGKDQKSYDEVQDNDLRVGQCSVADSSETIPPHGSSSPYSCVIWDAPRCRILNRFAQTSVETLDTAYMGVTGVQCSAIWPPGWPTVIEYCNFTSGIVIRPRVEMDQVAMESFFFPSLDLETLTFNAVHEAVHMSTLDQGVCTNTTYQSNPTDTNTRDGSYSLTKSQCAF